MSRQLPFLTVQGPDGQAFTAELAQERLTIGRYREFNDVALEPDPQQLVTRKVHCAIERDAGGWWLVDNGSVNRTFVQRGSRVEVVPGRSPLGDGDVIRILGRLTEAGEPLYWELTFRDPAGTRRAECAPRLAYLEYDDQRSRANGNVPVMCTYEELIAAIWGDEPGHTDAEVNHLVWELRQKIEPDPRAPRFLESVRGLGYRLVARPGQ